MQQDCVIDPALEPLKWLIGRWTSKEEGVGTFPTIGNFKYMEEIEFTSFGQPLLQYTAKSRHPEKNSPMHYESGFLRIKPGTNTLAFMVAHNFGLVTLEEGTVDGNKIVLNSNVVGRMEFAKDPAVQKLQRELNFNSDCLEQIVYMETSKTPLSKHLRCVYTKADS